MSDSELQKQVFDMDLEPMIANGSEDSDSTLVADSDDTLVISNDEMSSTQLVHHVEQIEMELQFDTD